MVDVIICHWVGLMVDKKAGPDGFGYTAADKMTLFYAYYGLIDSNNPVWLQWVFDIIIGIFERFGIINNMENMVTMVCQTVPITRQQSSAAYGWRMNGEEDPNHVNQRQKLVWGGLLIIVRHGIHDRPTPDAANLARKVQARPGQARPGQARPLPHPLPIIMKN